MTVIPPQVLGGYTAREAYDEITELHESRGERCIQAIRTRAREQRKKEEAEAPVEHCRRQPERHHHTAAFVRAPLGAKSIGAGGSSALRAAAEARLRRRCICICITDAYAYAYALRDVQWS